MPKNDLDFFFIYTAILYTLTVVDVVVVVVLVCAMRRNKTTAFWCWPHANSFSVTGPLSRWYHAIQSHVKAN